MPNLEFQIIRNPTRDELYENVVRDLGDYPLRELVFKPGVSLYDQLQRDRTGRVRGVVLLTGGGGQDLEVNDLYKGRPLYEEEMRMSVDPDVTVFGDCLGKQIGVAGFQYYVEGRRGPYVERMTAPYDGTKVIKMFDRGLPEEVIQVGSHDYYVPTPWVPKSLQVLGVSGEDGKISEIVYSRERSFYGQQFHSERHPGDFSLAAYATRFAAMDELARAA